MKPCNERKEIHLDIEELELRVVPGTLTITPPGVIGSGSPGVETQIPSTSPKFGLTMAHDRTGGVISWAA